MHFKPNSWHEMSHSVNREEKYTILFDTHKEATLLSLSIKATSQPPSQTLHVILFGCLLDVCSSEQFISEHKFTPINFSKHEKLASIVP